jgi:hypothetical protein
LLYFDGLLEFYFIFSFGIFFKKISKKEILSTNGTAFMGSLNGKKFKKKGEKNDAPTPTLHRRTRKNYAPWNFT